MRPSPVTLPGEAARDALREAVQERAPVRYLATRAPAPNVSPVLLDVTGSRPSSGWRMFLAGAACAALILAALFFSL